MLSPDTLRTPLPPDWDLIVACDTGTYMSAIIAAVCPDPHSIFALEEFPNYRYVSNEIELLGLSVPEWARWVHAAYQRYRPCTKVHLWADPNSQFKTELAHYNLHLQSNFRQLELRVEIAREYLQAQNPERCFLAPWLKILPYELEHAEWPDETTSAGKFVRIKRDDHTLDCFEHICSRRPRSKLLLREKKETFLQRYLREHRRESVTSGDPHLGRL